MQAQNTLIIGQQERTEELNRRLFDRIVPSSLLKPNFDPRPASTQRTKLPIVETRKQPQEGGRNYLDFTPESVFYSGTTNGPVQGYLSNVSTENDLRNQTRSLQRNDPLSTYIPSSTSDLYNVSVAPSRPETQPHPILFQRFNYAPRGKFHPKIGNDVFNNHSRTQLRNLE